MHTETEKQTPSLSFEFFPPHSTEANLRLWRSVERLAPLAPKFVSVTYGAGGATRERTMAAIATIKDRARLNIAGHLTCVGASKAETLDVARAYAKMGVKRIVALRGDAPKGDSHFTPHPQGFASAAELVQGLKEAGDFNVSVAAYPEKHPEAESLDADIENLKRKVDAGASQAITQFFFDKNDFLRFRDQAIKAGVNVPIIPGILPIENFAKMTRFAALCQANVPDLLHKAFENANSPEETEILSTALATEMCDDLMQEGVQHLHFYTLNNPDLTYNICRGLGLSVNSFAAQNGLVA